MIPNKSSAVFALVCLLFLSGCAATKGNMGKEEFSTVMTELNADVDSMLGKGKQEDAVKALNDMAKRNPSRKEPWLRLAKIYFDSARYVQAISASEEVLQRDNADRQAKSIRAVSGLRVAANSLNDLKDDVALKGDARPDAVGLAKVIRETLGEDVLVPPGDEAKKKGVSGAKSKPAPKQIPAVRPQQTAAPANAPSSGGANPFNSLK